MNLLPGLDLTLLLQLLAPSPQPPAPSLCHTIVPEASSPLPGLEFVTRAIKS